jgi:hypothetical protein
MKTIEKKYETELGTRRKQKTLTIRLMLSKKNVYQSGNIFYRKKYVWKVVRNENLLTVYILKKNEGSLYI